MTRCLIDTNILIYAVEKKETSKHEMAVKLIDDLSAKGDLVLSSQNLAEFSRILLEKTTPPQNHDTVLNYVYRFIRFSILIRYSEETIAHAILFSREYGIHFFDALLVATMQENGVSKILTENTNDFKKISWLEARNPFKK